MMSNIYILDNGDYYLVSKENNNVTNNNVLLRDKKYSRKQKQKQEEEGGGGRGGEDPLKKDAKIGIVGGGIGGLSTALALKRAGFTNIVVYERDESFGQYRRDGYGLTLTYNPKGPLAKLGILEQVCQEDTPSRSHYLFQAPKGNILGYYGRAFSSYSNKNGNNKVGVSMGQRGNLRIPRQKLREILLQELLLLKEKKNTKRHEAEKEDSICIEVRWGKRLVDFAYCSNAIPTTAYDTQPNEERKEQEEAATDDFVTLYFADGTKDRVELMVAADGVHSTVQNKVEKDQQSNVMSGDNSYCINSIPCTLQYIGIMLINGITLGFHHPLLDERGFYTVDGENRLFTMPFEGSHVDDYLMNFLSTEEEEQQHLSGAVTTPKTKRRTMWQLSFRLPDLSHANQLRQGGPKVLLEEALKRCSSWHTPVCEMLRSTPLDCVWGAGLVDRMPSTNKTKRKTGSVKQQSRRIVILGDAMHAMSPFKGQGANQALTDGPLLVDWLCRKGTNLTAALSHFEREMIHRTRNKVIASREAAIYLHSPQVLQTQHDFSGVPKELLPNFLRELQIRNITASTGGQLDETIHGILREMSIVTSNINTRADDDTALANHHSSSNIKSEQLLRLAGEGNLSELRKISLLNRNPTLIQTSRVADTGETCLHLAAKNGHYDVCRWLLSEGYFSSTADHLDYMGHCPLIAAIAGVANPQVIAMMLATSWLTTNKSEENELLPAIEGYDDVVAQKKEKIVKIVQNITDEEKRCTVIQLLMRSKYRLICN